MQSFLQVGEVIIVEFFVVLGLLVNPLKPGGVAGASILSIGVEFLVIAVVGGQYLLDFFVFQLHFVDVLSYLADSPP